VALREVHGVDAPTPAPGTRAGRTDGEIARLILAEAGITGARVDECAAAVREHACRAYESLAPADLSDRVLPGVEAVLDDLSGQDRVTLGLLTGNFEPIARLKLGLAGIGHYFAPGQGAFGSDSEDRAALPAIARARAGADGVPYARSRTVVIGDTPRDIACARADQVRCVAVATGPFGADQLVGADAVARDASELPVALRQFVG
jgi:phosphoglycolate phosphatase-like HAD superfamily hydrolase